MKEKYSRVSIMNVKNLDVSVKNNYRVATVYVEESNISEPFYDEQHRNKLKIWFMNGVLSFPNFIQKKLHKFSSLYWTPEYWGGIWAKS